MVPLLPKVQRASAMRKEIRGALLRAVVKQLEGRRADASVPFLFRDSLQIIEVLVKRGAIFGL
jgi:hypothetical protein